MPNGSSRVLPVILSLVVGAVVGWLVGCAQQAPAPQPTPTVQPPPAIPKGTSVILVGPKASDLTIPKIKISKNNEDILFWAAKKKNQQLWIELDDDIFEVPPVRGKYALYRVKCEGRRCFSGEIKPDTPADPNKEHKYWQILLDSAGNELDHADGMIIIEP